MQQTTGKLLAKMVTAWRYFVELQKLDRMSQQRQDDMVAASVEFERYQHECLCMDREDGLAAQMRADEAAEVERARKAVFREQSRQVFQVRKIKKQEEARTALKKKREEAQSKLAEAAWIDIEQMAVAKARTSAEDWLRTPQGQTELQAAATYIYEDPPANVSKMLQNDPTYSNVPDCAWLQAYFYHSERLEKVLCDELTMKAALAIASEQLIQLRINTMKVQLAQRGEEEKTKFQRNAAAKRIQMLFRCRQAKKYVRSLLRYSNPTTSPMPRGALNYCRRPLVMKRIDAATGRLVYFNIQERTTSYAPPRLMGAAEGTLPVESSTWVRRVDGASGEQFYMDMTTGETSWMPPNYYVMCTQCKMNFCTSRSTATGERFCVSCYAELAKLQRQADKAANVAGDGIVQGAAGTASKPWTRIAVVPAKCCVCKVNNGEVLCHECHGDTTCSRCFTVLHKNPKLKTHTKHESLVYTLPA
ncbi:hypothetical protein DYB32_000107 [Aphanomyces invadans]|uniref:WW domain-containing protein n=1 Tax=Aphanomyces invadans TaxID=157072 RepID=A0A3R6Z6I5_9STRA|nr:hypothetical protein DYB32_000107 [Aphanomyces invadans]